MLSLSLLATPAEADWDDYDLGNGHHGPLTVSAQNETINSVAAVAVTAPTGALDVKIETAPAYYRKAGGFTDFAPGDLVMALVTRGSLSPPVGDATPLALAETEVGRYTLRRVVAASTDKSTVTLDRPLPFSLPGARSQIIHVPEYTSVTFNAGTSITGFGYDGYTGGVVALLVQGSLVGPSGNVFVSATGLGAAGGPYAPDTQPYFGCSAYRLTGTQAGGVAGNIFEFPAPGRVGFGNAANGGGGGNCSMAGGGGGAGVGAGGRGGDSAGDDACSGQAPCTGASAVSGPRRPVGGLGGAPLVYSPLGRLLLGGGGGAGHGTAALNSATSGARGGGIVFARATSFVSSGGTLTVSANGGNGCAVQSPFVSCGAAATFTAGGPGGGGGGTVHVRLRQMSSCAGLAFEAKGGRGGATLAPAGPGGGGGAGAVYLEAPLASACTVSLTAGAAGSSSSPSSEAPGGASSAQTLLARTDPQPRSGSVRAAFSFRVVPPPSITEPLDANVPRFDVHVRGNAEPASTLSLTLDNDAPFTATAEQSGSFDVALGALAVGSHTVRISQVELEIASVATTVVFTAVDCTGDQQCTAALGRAPVCLQTQHCGCASDGQCAGSSAGHRCIAEACGCVANTDCSATLPTCGDDGQCRACATRDDCDGAVCHDGRCVACRGDVVDHCAGSNRPFCNEAMQCVSCTLDAHCADDPRGLLCLGGVCVCSSDQSCRRGKCVNGSCAAECSTDDDCASGPCLSGRCVEVPTPPTSQSLESKVPFSLGCASAPLDTWWVVLVVRTLSGRRRRGAKT